MTYPLRIHREIRTASIIPGGAPGRHSLCFDVELPFPPFENLTLVLPHRAGVAILNGVSFDVAHKRFDAWVPGRCLDPNEETRDRMRVDHTLDAMIATGWRREK